VLADRISPLARTGVVRQGVRVDEGQVTEVAAAPMRLIHGPVVDAADPLDEHSETAELPSATAIRVEIVRLIGPERLVPEPGSGLRGWAGRFGVVLRRCGGPLLGVAVVTAGPMQLFAVRVSDMMFAAPALSGMLGGTGLLLLPVMWLAYLGLAALPVVLCLTATVGVVVGWSSGGTLPGVRVVVRLVGHRVGLLWVWLAVLGAVSQALPLLAADPVASPRLALALSAGLAVLSTGLALLMGILGCVVLFERGQGPRRAQRLLIATPPGSFAVLFAASAALTVLPPAADTALGALGAAATATLCALLWSVASLITYAQARRAEGPVTSAALSGELAY
jgi:hypothetical protein